jgi:hypothetical protein
MATVTSSRRRNERGSGSKKVAASTPKPRQTSVGNRGAQAGPLKPGTRTSGTPMVNSSSPAMRQIQAKASELRSQVDKGVRAARQTATSLPNSVRAGQNLVRQGAQNMRQAAAGTMSAAQRTALQAQGAAAKAAAQAKRGAKAAMGNMSKTLANKGSIRPGRAIGSLKGGLAGAAVEQVASRTLSPIVQKAGYSLGQNIRKAMTPKPTKKASDSFGGQYQKGKAAPSKAPKMSKAKSFDNAFASARNSGMKTFTWEGKTYNTKKKGEK